MRVRAHEEWGPSVGREAVRLGPVPYKEEEGAQGSEEGGFVDTWYVVVGTVEKWGAGA